MTWIPKNDTQFESWMENFLTVLPGHLADFGMVEDDIATLIMADAQFESRLTGHIAAQSAAKAATSAKDSARGVTELHLKTIVRRINNHPAMTNEIRDSLGLPRRGAERSIVRVATTEQRPALFVETQRGAVYIHFGTNPVNERLNGKPEGVKGCNIYRKREGDPRFEMIVLATTSPYVDRVSGPASDYVYVARYRGTKADDLGPESLEAKIAAGGALEQPAA